MASDLVAPTVPNNFHVAIDNTHCSHEVTNVRIDLVRNTIVTHNGENVIEVKKEPVGTAGTTKGGPKNQHLMMTIPVITPSEIVEKHTFNMGNGKTRYGSVTAPTYSGQLVNVSYGYELRVWHKATVGKDNVTLIEIPVTVACLTPNVHQQLRSLMGI